MTCSKVARWLLIVFLCLLAALFAASLFAASPAPYDGICKIVHGNDWTGSGSMMRLYHNDEYAVILTVAHVGGQEGDVVDLYWKNADDQHTIGTVATILKRTSNSMNAFQEPNRFQTDLCIILSKAPKGVKPLTYTAFRAQDGPFVGIGYRGKSMWVTIATAGYEHGGLIYTNTDYIGGQSGGCLLNKNGQLVGVISASVDGADIGIAVDGENLRKLLEMYK